jgi:hypothetical protein
MVSDRKCPFRFLTMLKPYAISIPGAAAWSRKQFDELADGVKRPQVGMQGACLYSP